MIILLLFILIWNYYETYLLVKRVKVLEREVFNNEHCKDM